MGVKETKEMEPKTRWKATSKSGGPDNTDLKEGTHGS